MWSDAINFISNQIDYVNAEEILIFGLNPHTGLKEEHFQYY